MKIYIGLLLLTLILFESCNSVDNKKKTSTQNNKSTQEYLDNGVDIASTTFNALSSQLQKAMKDDGVANALEYCNLNAYTITDSLSMAHNALIKRTSNKIRNPNNRPSPLELEVMQYYNQQSKDGRILAPFTRKNKEIVDFFAPILVNDLCLKCHGTVGSTIAASDYQQILKYYPEDNATGYKTGELRGIWSIRFNH